MKSQYSALKLFFIYFRFFNIVYSFFDIDELKSINYGIDIRNEPVVMKADDDSSDLNTVQLTSKYGQIYQCNFPNTAEQEKEKVEAEKSAVETGIPDLLKPMETGPCLKMNNGWWSYEFCYGRHIHQFHLNEENKVEGEVLSLGIYESEFDWEDNPGQSDHEKRQSRLKRYHTQQYVNGTQCDLNGNLRKTEVRFMCEEGSGDYIKRVDEPETCSYIMTVHTTKICHHPFLKPPTPTKTVSITCHPLLTVVQYQEYLDEIEAKEESKRQEEERQRLKEEELQRVAKEKAKYFEKSQDSTGEETAVEDPEQHDGMGNAKGSDSLFKDLINAAKGLEPGDTPLEVNAVYQVLNEPSDVDEFIKKAIKEMERLGKDQEKSKAKTKPLTEEEEDLLNEEKEHEEKEEEEEEVDEEESNQELNTDNMQRFGDDDSDQDVSTNDVQQAVDALRKVQRDHAKKLSKLSRLQLENLRQARRNDNVEEKEEEEEEEEGVVEDESDEEAIQDTKRADKKDKLFKDVERKTNTMAEKQRQFREEAEAKGEFSDTEDLSDLMDKVDQQLKQMLTVQKEMKGIEDDITRLLEEEDMDDQEIKTIKSKYQDKRSKLLDIKQRLKKLMEKQYESIVKEAEQELGMENEVDRSTATQELAKTLDGLLAKMDKTEQEIKDVDKELEQFAEFDSEEKDVKSVPPVRNDLEPVKGPTDTNGDDRVQVRVSRIKQGQKITMGERDKNTEALEKSVQEELAKAGFANGDKIQVKIITSYYEGDDDSVHTLSEKDSETFRNLIVNLIGGTSEGEKEAVRHQEQEDNYSFVFGKRDRQTAEQSDNSALTDIQSGTDRHTDTHTDRQTEGDTLIEDDGS